MPFGRHGWCDVLRAAGDRILYFGLAAVDGTMDPGGGGLLSGRGQCPLYYGMYDHIDICAMCDFQLLTKSSGRSEGRPGCRLIRTPML